MKKWIAILLLLALLTGCNQNAATPTEPTAPSQPAVSVKPTEPEQNQEEEMLFVHFIDVGQADCTLLKLGDLDILIDGGNGADGYLVSDYLIRLGVDDIELMVATHPHEDHYGGLPTVLRQVKTEAVWVTTNGFVNSLYSNFCTTAQNVGLKPTIPEVGTIFSQDGLTLTVLGPVKEYEAYEDPNDTSLVIKAEYGQHKFLFTGDMETLAEHDLLATGTDLSADVLKVGHHGSYSSSSVQFLQAVGAQYGVIHVGRDNDYGHPHSAAMNRLLGAEITLLRTDRMGNVVIGSDGEQLAFMWSFYNAYPQER